MSDKYTTYQQHEPLRVPEGWNTQEKKLINQLEEILDDIYRRFGRLRLKDMEPSVREEITETAEGIQTLSTTVEQQGGQITLLAERKLDSDQPSVGVTNSSVIIDPDGIDLSTSENGQIVSRVGEDIELQIDKTGVTGKKGVFDTLEAPNIITSFEGGDAPWKGTIQATIDALPKFLKGETTITIPAGTYNESLVIVGFMGEALNLINAAGEKVTIIGHIEVRSCSNWIRLQATAQGLFEVYPDVGANTIPATINAQAVALLSVWMLMISGYRGTISSANPKTQCGVKISGCRFAVSSCVVEYVNQCVYAGDGSSGVVNACKGGGSTNTNNYGLFVITGSHVAHYGTTTFKSTSGNNVTNATLLTSGDLTPTEGGISYVAPTSFTQTFAPTKHVTYLLGWSRTRDDTSAVMTQGSYRGKNGSNRFNAGLIWFDGVASALAGKTIDSATLTIRRASGGYSNAVPVWLTSSTLTSANYNTTYTPVLRTPTNVGSLSRETAGTYTVTSLMNDIKNGGAFAVYEPDNTTVTDTWSPAYTQFYGHLSQFEPVLTVTYH